MRISKKTLFAAPLAVLGIATCLLFATQAHAVRLIILAGSAGTQNGMVVCDCTLPANGCGCVIPSPSPSK